MPEPRSEFLKWVKTKYPRDWQKRSADPAVYWEWQRWTQTQQRVESAISWKPPAKPPVTPPPVTPPPVTPPSAPTIISSGGYDWMLVPDITGSGQDMWEKIGVTRTERTEGSTWTTQTPEIFTDEQGNQWLKQTDQDGNVNWVFKGTAPTTGMTDWQKAQLGLEQQKIDWTKLQGVEATKQAQWNYAQQRLVSRFDRSAQEKTELQRQINELQFERDRERLLSGIPSNDWIRQYTLQNQPNPYRKREVSPIDQLEQNLDNITGQIQQWQAAKTEAEIALSGMAMTTGGLAMGTAVTDPMAIRQAKEQKETAEAALESLKASRESAYKTWKDVEEESIGWTPQPVPQPYPNAPGWLPQYAPGLQAGQMITKQNVPTPSGQQLTAMSQTQLEQLGYYGKWAGGLTGKYPWEQLTEQAKLMQPRTPSGAGRFGWTPSRQV